MCFTTDWWPTAADGATVLWVGWIFSVCVSYTVLTVSADAAWEAGWGRNVERGHLFGHQGHHAALWHLKHKGMNEFSLCDEIRLLIKGSI